ncbi:hypothetical protein KIP88_27500 [Bradyrhizobium sp. SRL28]|uniref:CorA family divalent cation transporter n=1 Tax=Bradyrhizobium sp. SRL28 TaxID=2836178 RepID=UPI001BDE96D4|nr:CorA family divalent cation transporter [Bradyrhizobium sp. SRL28]MBT1514243.1 hypothetical protein [Bradyrhizobium sp. SRL28]
MPTIPSAFVVLTVGTLRFAHPTALTACMLPSTLVTGFFGMNTKDMPFQTGDGGTWYALLLVIAAGALTWWLLRRTKAL